MASPLQFTYPSTFYAIPPVNIQTRQAPFISTSTPYFSEVFPNSMTRMQMNISEQAKLNQPKFCSFSESQFITPPKLADNIQSKIIPESLPKEDKKDIDEESLSDIPDSLIKSQKISVSGYKSRNVFKSILRRMWAFTRTKKADIVEMLKKVGYSITRIEHVFFKISQYNDIEKNNGNKKKTRLLICKMIAKKTIYTHILKDTLHDMIQKWDTGRLGRVASNNLTTYKELCNIYYNAAMNTLAEAKKEEKAGNSQLSKSSLA
jgi:hypothetical protein